VRRTDGRGAVGADERGRYVLRSPAGRWLALHEEIKGRTRHLERITEAGGPYLTAAFGIGARLRDCAAERLMAAGGNGERIRSAAAGVGSGRMCS